MDLVALSCALLGWSLELSQLLLCALGHGDVVNSMKPDHSATEKLMESTNVLADYFPTANTLSSRFLKAVHLPAQGDDLEFFSRHRRQSLEIAGLPALFHGCGFQVVCVATSWMCLFEDSVEVFLLDSLFFGLGVLADMDASACLRDSGWQGRKALIYEGYQAWLIVVTLSISVRKEPWAPGLSGLSAHVRLRGYSVRG